MGERTARQIAIQSEGQRLFLSSYGAPGYLGTLAAIDPLFSKTEARQAGALMGQAIDGFAGYFAAMQAAVTIQWMQYGFYGREQRQRADIINHTLSFICFQAMQDIGLTTQIVKKVVYHIISTKPASVVGRMAGSTLVSRALLRGAVAERSPFRRLAGAAPEGRVSTPGKLLLGSLILVSNFTMASYGSAVLLINDGLRGLEHIVSGALTGERLSVPLESIAASGDDQALLDALVVADEVGDFLRELYEWASDFPLLNR